MRNKYFNKVVMLLKQTYPKLATTYQLEFKNVFGTVGGYVNGHIFISCGKFGVAVKLPPKILESLLKERGVKRLKYFPKGHVKKEYAVLPKRILADKHQFKDLLKYSVDFVSSLPKRKKSG